MSIAAGAQTDSRRRLPENQLAVRGVDGPAEAVRLANDVELGLTTGLYSEDPVEVDRFFDDTEVGVLFVNRATGATSRA